MVSVLNPRLDLIEYNDPPTWWGKYSGYLPGIITFASLSDQSLVDMPLVFLECSCLNLNGFMS